MEGGYFCQSYRCTETIPLEALPSRYKTSKIFGSAIYYLLTPDQRSAMHRLPTDEIFHFYLGDPVIQLQLYPDSSSDVITIGADIAAGHRPQVVVPRFTWQGSLLTSGGRFALLGTTMAPGFDYSEYEAGIRKELVESYPDREDLIIKLTKD